MSYAAATKKPPKTLSEAEQRAVLRASGEHKDGFRDHVILSLALGTALREHEIAALNVGDVFANGKPRRRITLHVFKGSKKDEPTPAAEQEVFVPDDLRYKLEKLWRYKRAEKEPLSDDAPLFLSREGARLATRSIRHLWGIWQKRAGLERHFPFHSLRHTALTNLYRRTKDIRLVQRAARHANIQSTTIYAGPSDEDVLRAVRDLPC